MIPTSGILKCVRVPATIEGHVLTPEEERSLLDSWDSYKRYDDAGGYVIYHVHKGYHVAVKGITIPLLIVEYVDNKKVVNSKYSAVYQRFELLQALMN